MSTAAIRLDECAKGRGRVVCDIKTSGYIVCEGKYASVRRLEQTGNGILRGLNCTPAQLPALSTLKIERSSETCDNFKFPGARVFLMKKECGVRLINAQFINQIFRLVFIFIIYRYYVKKIRILVHSNIQALPFFKMGNMFKFENYRQTVEILMRRLTDSSKLNG
ncbi:MAG: hypothetical protein ABW185_01400 [Sedimenticola sp.]